MYTTERFCYPLTDRQDVAPTYIINIHHSTLNNCIFGSNNGQHINADRQYPPSYSPERLRHEAERCSCSCGQQGPAQSFSAPQSLQVHSSDMEYVIIGDNNTLTVETVGQEEEEEGEVEEQTLI
ncbi:hypothetical protein SKAU_G00214310 [Synaphobranchus kaupii]|uniref:Uncharacterized protein n=1 Tax=Synaphobranchus kaupii TaxID=118154 RepID=A0A9Q1F9I4_SYNKA|nr:hypothetical protein SKAU_G00214310 [Synaphobranchus kaupii]